MGTFLWECFLYFLYRIYFIHNFHRAKIKAVGLPVVMQRNVVECITRTKFIGVIIDNKLKWNDHIT